MPAVTTPVTPEEAWAAVLAGKAVRLTVGTEHDDPVSLLYVDRCHEFLGEPQIYAEAIAGWSEGIKEAVCEPESSFFLEFVKDAHRLEVTDQEPPQREHDPAEREPFREEDMRPLYDLAQLVLSTPASRSAREGLVSRARTTLEAFPAPKEWER
jgi:hypothetical protein